MKRVVILGLLLVTLACLPVLANEGMWPPEQLPELAETLRQLGLEIDVEQLSSLTEHPMNAVVSLGGCTASFVSPKGLIVTNHHCAYGSIQHNSTAEKNLIETGYLAASPEEELRASPGSRVYVTVEFRDVTNEVLGNLREGLSGQARYAEIDKRRKVLIADCEKEPNSRCRVASYYGGLKYSLVRQLELRDIRLVYAPAAGIGVFGGDIDNWMWPRHTGDYSFYRAYVAPDGKSADYSINNVPYQPKHSLKVSTVGLDEGDLVMVAGYPGSTSRYRLASEVEDSFTWTYARRIEAYQEWLDIIAAQTRGRDEAAVKYASLKSGLNNTLKNNQGMLEGFAKSDMLEKKRALERELSAWIAADAGRNEKYGTALTDLKSELDRIQATRERNLYYSYVERSSSMLSAAKRLYRLAKERQKPDMEREAGYQERDLVRIKQSLQRIDRTFDPVVELAAFRHFILKYHHLPEDSRVPALDEWFGLEQGKPAVKKVDKKLAQMYGKTRLADSEHRLSLMNAEVSDLEASKDPFLQMAVQLYPEDAHLELTNKTNQGNLQQLRPRYMEAIIAYRQSLGEQVYPDANGTLRVTFGTVKGYTPHDAVVYRPFTTIEGVLEKDTGTAPFNTPENALQVMRSKDYAPWASDQLSSVPVNFLSTCDTTGGNSGSASLNGKGELVGLLFDGNYESMIADWDFMPAITRSIHVDIRYVLWTMDKVDQAHHLLEEMGVE